MLCAVGLFVGGALEMLSLQLQLQLSAVRQRSVGGYRLRASHQPVRQAVQYCVAIVQAARYKRLD